VNFFSQCRHSRSVLVSGRFWSRRLTRSACCRSREAVTVGQARHADTALHVDDDALLLGGFNDTHQVHAASRLAIWLAGTYAVSAHPPSAGGGRSATASATATINSAV